MATRKPKRSKRTVARRQARTAAKRQAMGGVKRRAGRGGKRQATRGAKPQTAAEAAPTPGGGGEGDVVDMAEAIRLLKTTRPTFYRWLRSGRIKGMKVGRQWRFYRADVERFLQGEPPRIDLPASIEPLIRTLEQRCREAGARKLPADDLDPVERAVNLMILLAAATSASDIHVTTNMPMGSMDNLMLVRNRIDGVLHVIAETDVRLLPAIVARWKTMAACDVNEKRLPQDGRILITLGELGGEKSKRQLDLRVSFLPAAMGEAVTVRILDRETVSLDLDRIDYAPRDREALLEAVGAPWGLIVITGPAGCGKTTTAYSCLMRHARPEVKILTVEDPVEYVLPWCTQTHLNNSIGLTFERCVRAMLRSDPDILFVGEIRNREILNVCLQAALTGHLVISTLHANDAALALQRMVEMGVDPFIVADGTNLTMSQRLIRKLCPDCSKPGEPEVNRLRLAQEAARRGGVDPQSLQTAFRVAVGCDRCARTGYKGRTTIAEMLEMTPEIGQALRNGAKADALRTLAVGQGMTTMAADGYRRAATGETTLDEVMRLVG
jgi:type IV pilus assembly protein PilB